MSLKERRRNGALALLAVAALLTSACAGGGSASTTDGGDEAPTASASPVSLEELAAGDYGAPPTSAPPIAEDKSIWIVSCGQNAIGCAIGAESAKEAAESLGWTAQVCDGQLNAGGAFADCVRQGIAAGVDGIVTEAIDCSVIQDPLREAEAADIVTVNFWGFDCDQGVNPAGDPLFSASVQPSEEYASNEDYQFAVGQARAEWIIAASGGEAEIIELEFKGTNIGGVLSAGFHDAIESCGSCTVHTVDVTHQTFGDARQIVESALLQHPAAEWVAIPLESLVLLGAAQAVASSPRSSDISLIGGEGFPPNLDLIREDQGQSASVGQPIGWYGYGAIDTINRVFNGESAVPQGMSFQIVDAEHNLPDEGGYVPPVDYESAYREAWGV
ncbi:substrate-binding domain-containing protein [Leucobacter weissii]|uniref:Substrate-binding domain-containing protein n=1 Tax=Leucobacter weissii TaxID=1983706 RepID=A0A939MND6_9MICO|nr:substrate-binding domain-containing protein [Leucobacter weissii]MBO1901762.1 substrate-binding domain-containing protein [Leucobacter weissii]